MRRLPGLTERDDQVIASSLEDPPRFVEVFDRHSKAVHAYIARRAGPGAADDLLAEIWLQAFRSRDRYAAGVPDARPWLYGIAKHVLHTHWRSRQRQDGAIAMTSFDPWPDVDDRIDASDRAAAIRRALGSVGPEDREVLLLVAWEQLTPAEVAAALGVPGGTVRWRLHRARAQLRAALLEAGELEAGELEDGALEDGALEETPAWTSAREA